MKIKYSLLFILLLIAGKTSAQFTEFHPELKWYTIKGKHCVVHYHEGTERTARIIAKIGDEVWQPITSLYEYEPELVHYVVKDIDDYSNGATYFFDNKIEIWTSALDFELRGEHNWLRNVISHEFTHLVQIQASLKASRQIPAIYFQYLNYEDERRPDILYGFPNFIVSYPLAAINMPAWFAEGTAQYMRKEFDYDKWDSQRDMILRSYVLDDKMLTWNQMGVFEKTSLGNESVYNSGFALTRFIAQKFGEDKLRLITKRLGAWKNFTFDAAVEDVLGISGQELYNEWKSELKKIYTNQTAQINLKKIEGEEILSEGFGNTHPIFSKDGKKIYYVSNKNSDYFSPSGIYEYDIETKESKLLLLGVRTQFSLTDDNKIIFSKLTDDNPNWYNVHDIFEYDLTTKEEKRLTLNLRANQPNLSHDGTKIVFLFQKDGTTNLGIVNRDGSNFTALTSFENGEQVFNPKFSPDDSEIYFEYSFHHGKDIAKLNLSSYKMDFVLNDEHDERNPFLISSEKMIYSSDESGIFNLYEYNLKTETRRQITNVIGGTFHAAADNQNNIVYSGYTSSGFKIFLLDDDGNEIDLSNFSYIKHKNFPLGEDNPNGDINKFNLDALRNFNDRVVSSDTAVTYSGSFSKITFFPLIRFDNYNKSNSFSEKIKPGVYVTSSDMLNRYSFFAGAATNSRWERDLFLVFDYRNKLPLLYNIGLKPELSLEVYNISRKADVEIFIDEFPAINTDVTYNLFEVDLAARHRIFSREQELEIRYAFSRYTATIGSFIIPNLNALYPTSDDTYLIGSNFLLKYTFATYERSVDTDINPVGARIELRYNFELNKFNPDGEYTVESGMLIPQYKHYDFHRLEINTNYSMKLFASHTLALKLKGGTIFGAEVPDFFDFYIGGLVGMKAYPFYSISGNEMFLANLTYRFPLWKNIDAKVGHLYIDKIFFSVYGDLGDAWNGNPSSHNKIKKGAGTELRFALNSFYLFPTSIFVNAAYGFDKFERIARDKIVSYGNEWRFYGGVLFGFDF